METALQVLVFLFSFMVSIGLFCMFKYRRFEDAPNWLTMTLSVLIGTTSAWSVICLSHWVWS